MTFRNSKLDPPLFRMKINKSPTSPLNSRCIEPQMNRYRPFDQIWVVKIKEKKTVYFSSLTSKFDLSLSLFLFSYGDNQDQEEEEDYFDSGRKKKFSRG